MKPRVQRLAWEDQVLGALDLPGGRLTATLGLGSGLCRGHRPGQVWAIGDRGPNLKVPLCIEAYGLTGLEPLKDIKGAKVMPLPNLGPMLCELEVQDGAVRLVQGLPLPGGPESVMEPVFGLDGRPLGTHADGADTEGVAAFADGSFWVSEEYGPSLLRVDATGLATRRLTPEGLGLAGAGCPIEEALPAIALQRRLNRGFEAVTLSPCERRLYVAFQSALERPGEPQDVVRIWTLDALTGAFLDEDLYPFEKPKAFKRDDEAGKVGKDDLKICDLACPEEGRLLVLERISRTSKVFAVELGRKGRDHPAKAIAGDKTLKKRLLLDTDEHREIIADLEGVALLSDRELLLVNDNDFGIEGAETAFFKVVFDTPF